MSEEFRALQRMHTWNLVTLSSGFTPVGCRWVYKTKTRTDGSVERYKAHRVAREFTQAYGIDYEETFAPVAKMTIVRLLLAIAAARQWPLYQLDVTNAFLHGDLSEEVYMTLPFGLPHSPQRVCRLRRAIYGLKRGTTGLV